MSDITDTFRGLAKIFAGMIEKDENVRVWAIPAPGGGSRAFCDRMVLGEEGQPGLGYIFYRDSEGAGPVAKNIGEDRTEALQAHLGLSDGDAVFFVAGVPKNFAYFAGQARTQVGDALELVDEQVRVLLGRGLPDVRTG